MELDVVALGQLLGHPVRVAILMRLAGRKLAVKEIADSIGVPHGVASFHLGRLFNAELVAFKVVGRRHVYFRPKSGPGASLLTGISHPSDFTPPRSKPRRSNKNALTLG